MPGAPITLPLRDRRAVVANHPQNARAPVPDGEPGEGQIAGRRLPLAVGAGAGRRVVRAVGARPERKPASASSGLSLPDFDAEATDTTVAGTPASATSSTGPRPTDNDPPARRACASSNEPASSAGEPVDEKNVICPRAEDADPRIEVALQELMLGRSVPRRGPENVGSFTTAPPFADTHTDALHS